MDVSIPSLPARARFGSRASITARPVGSPSLVWPPARPAGGPRPRSRPTPPARSCRSPPRRAADRLAIPAPTFPLTLTDDEGTSGRDSPPSPRRSSRSRPPTTEILFALGVGDRIVGKVEDFSALSARSRGDPRRSEVRRGRRREDRQPRGGPRHRRRQQLQPARQDRPAPRRSASRSSSSTPRTSTPSSPTSSSPAQPSERPPRRRT